MAFGNLVNGVLRDLDDQVDILFGPYSSVLTSAAAPVAEEHGKLLWNHGGASDNVYQQGYRWVVGILTPASRYLAGLLPLVRQVDPDANTVALIRASTGEFPNAVCLGVTAGAEALGLKTVLSTEFEAATDDFSGVVTELKAARPDVVVIVGRVQNDLRLARQLVESGVNAGTAVAVAAGIQGFHDDLGSLAERFVGPSQWEASGTYPRDYGPTGAEVMALLQGKGHRPVDYPMVQAYAAGLVAQRCVEEAGTLEDSALRETAGRLDFSTFYGRFKIDPVTGCQLGRSTVLVQWQRGRKVIVGPSDQRQAPMVYPWRNQP